MMMVIDHTIQPPSIVDRERKRDTSCSWPCSSDIIIRKVHSLGPKKWWMQNLDFKTRREMKNSRIANTNRDRCRVCSFHPSKPPSALLTQIIRRSPPNSTSLIIYHHIMVGEQPTMGYWEPWPAAVKVMVEQTIESLLCGPTNEDIKLVYENSSVVVPRIIIIIIQPPASPIVLFSWTPHHVPL